MWGAASDLAPVGRKPAPSCAAANAGPDRILLVDNPTFVKQGFESGSLFGQVSGETCQKNSGSSDCLIWPDDEGGEIAGCCLWRRVCTCRKPSEAETGFRWLRLATGGLGSWNDRLSADFIASKVRGLRPAWLEGEGSPASRSPSGGSSGVYCGPEGLSRTPTDATLS